MPQSMLCMRSSGSELRAFLAIVRKEWRLMRRYPSWIVSLLVWPILLPLSYVMTASALSGPQGTALPGFQALTGTTDYRSFMVIGSVIWMWLNMTLWDVGSLLRQEQLYGTLESNWVCPISRLSLLIGAAFTRLLVSLGMLTLSEVVFSLGLQVQLIQGNLLLLLSILLLIIPSIYGIGIAFASLV